MKKWAQTPGWKAMDRFPEFQVGGQQMKYKIFKSENNRYIVVQVVEPMSRDLAIEIAIEVDKKRKEFNIKNLLYDMRSSKNVESITTNYFFAYEDLKKINIDKSMRVAILANPSDDSHDFVGTAIRNAGYNVCLFKEERLAVGWLEEDGF
jgi:hypothetical protein